MWKKDLIKIELKKKTDKPYLELKKSGKIESTFVAEDEMKKIKDTAYFSRTFTKVMGCSPSAYRKKEMEI